MADNKVEDILIFGAVGVGLYLLYQAYVSANTPAGTAAAPVTLASLTQAIENAISGGTPAAGAASAAAAPPPTNYTAVANESDTASALIDAAGGVNSLNVDQWNYYFYQLGGTVLTAAQSAAVATAAGGDSPMSVDAYLAALKAAGLPNTLSVTVSAPTEAQTTASQAGAATLATVDAAQNPYPATSPMGVAWQASHLPVSGTSGLGAVPVPVPLMFVYGPDKRPLLVIPHGVGA